MSLHRLATRDGRVRVEVCAYGLTIHRIEVQRERRTFDVLAGPEDAADHRALGRRFYGQVVGRYANRLPAGTWACRDGTLQLAEWGGAGISHHGGPPPSRAEQAGGPWDCVTWAHLPRPSMYTQAECDVWDASACFVHESPAGDQGYPGRVRVEALVGVRAGVSSLGQVHVEYRARIEDEASATPLNVTQHWGFYLGTSEPATVDGHTFRLHCDTVHRLVLDERGVPTGAVEACAGTPYDWTQPDQRIRPDADYDHFYVWGAKRDANAPIATLSGSNGLALVFRTNQTCVQMYVPPGPTGAHKALHAAYGPHHAVFLEWSAPHATFLRPALQAWAGGDTWLREGHMYQNYVTMDIEPHHHQPA